MLYSPAMNVSLILLAGGTGTRFGGPIPKQFLPLGNLPVVMHSLTELAKLPQLSETIVVCDTSFQNVFPPTTAFASPGATRTESVQNGLSTLSDTESLVLIHDGARPFVSLNEVSQLLQEAETHGAAVLGRPATNTIKIATEDGFVHTTPSRETLWEVYTPQCIRKSILRKAYQSGLTGTDDVSLVEALGLPVKLVLTKEANLKITHKNDYTIAKSLHEV